MSLIAYALAVAATMAPAASPVAPRMTDEVLVAQVMIRQRVIVRIPAQRALPEPLAQWREKRGPRCLAMNMLGGAAILQPDSIDLYLRGGARMRAQLDDECPALDYYSGFYVAPTKDGMVCAGRDPIRTRAGGSCAIDRFRVLVRDR